MTVDYVRMGFRSNFTEGALFTYPGGYTDVRDPVTGIRVAPSLITDVKTKADFDNILNNSPAVAIMNYDVIDGVAKIVFADGMITPDEALDKLGAKVIPAFRIQDNADADSLAAFLKGRNQRDVFAVSSTLSVLNRAYSNWCYIRGVADYSRCTSFDAETLRYDALANGARVLILPESTSRDVITQIQDSYSCVWLTVGEGKTASVAATNKGPYGLITPDRALTEYCYRTYYASNTLVRRTNVIGHRGNPSLAPENTILSTQTAYNNGANMVETDIYLTLDKVLYVMHDEKIDRTTNGTGNILEMTSAQVSKYKVDYFAGVTPQAIPTLEDQFKLIKANPEQKLVIEMKHPADASLANALADLIRKYDILDQVVVISFIQNNLVYLKQQLPGAPVGWLNWLKLDESDPVHAVYEALENIQPYNSVCNPGYSGWGSGMISELAHRGVTLWPWTVNNQAQFDKLMIDGVAGLTTDYSQWSKDFIESIHWNSASRVISCTYRGILTDVTNSVEVVVIEDTLGISCNAGNITVPQKKEGGKASFYYRLKSVTPTGLTYYTVTEVRTIEVASAYTFELKDTSPLCLEGSYLTELTDQYTVADLKNQFKHPVEVRGVDGAVLPDSAKVRTAAVVYLAADSTKCATLVLKGDVNGDSFIDTTDYLLIKNSFLGNETLTGVNYLAADCDGDGLITATDYLRIKAYFLDSFSLYEGD
jgi:glycerophosphoryl diester phosphodiesterase